MQMIRQFFAYHWMNLVVPLAVLVLTLAVGFGVKRVLRRLLSGWAARSSSKAGPLVAQALLEPFMIWVLILGIRLAVELSEVPPKIVSWSGSTLLALWILSLTVIATRLVGNLIRLYGSAGQTLLPVTTLTQNLAQLGVVITGLLFIARAMGMEITPYLTALGVGGLAVALALQDTLSNLFAGFYMGVAGQVRPGDYIRLSTGEEGYITDITWRSTTIRSLGNNMIIVPNAKLGQAVVTNFNLPEKRTSVSVQVRVSYDSDPERVEALLLEVARNAAREVAGLLNDPAPSVNFEPGFEESGLGMTLNCNIREFADQWAVRHALRKRILQRFREAGVSMPYPTRTVHVREHGA